MLPPGKELKACYGLLFAYYPDVVTVRQLQTMLGISRHAAYDRLGEGEIGAIKPGNGYLIPKLNVIRIVAKVAPQGSIGRPATQQEGGACPVSTPLPPRSGALSHNHTKRPRREVPGAGVLVGSYPRQGRILV